MKVVLQKDLFVRSQEEFSKASKEKTIAIIGFGQIGKAVAHIAKHGFGMQVWEFDVSPTINCDYIDYYSNDFKLVVKDADIISIHIAVVSETKGFINSERISFCEK